jgi:hypothetical protein
MQCFSTDDMRTGAQTERMRLLVAYFCTVKRLSEHAEID